MNFVACRLVAKRKKHKVHTNYQQFVLNFCHLFLANGQVGVTPKSSILRRFSMKKTIHFGAPPVVATTVADASAQPHFADIWAAPLGPRRGFRWRDHAQAAACSGRCPGTQIQDWQVPEGTRWPLSYHIISYPPDTDQEQRNQTCWWFNKSRKTRKQQKNGKDTWIFERILISSPYYWNFSLLLKLPPLNKNRNGFAILYFCWVAICCNCVFNCGNSKIGK